MPDRRGSPGGSESLRREERLRRRADFKRCYEQGRRRHGAFSILYAAPNRLRHPRLGITVSRKVGKAFVRFRVKRRIREIYRRWSKRGKLPAIDLVVHVKPAAGSAEFADLSRELKGMLTHLIRSRPPGP